MEIEHVVNVKTGKFVATEEDKEMGEVNYILSSESPDVIIIMHVGVRSEYKGKGVAAMLVKEVVKYARESGLKIVPKCPYAKKILEKGTEYSDVLK